VNDNRKHDKKVHKYIPVSHAAAKISGVSSVSLAAIVALMVQLNWLPWETASAAEDKYKLMLKMKTQDSEWYTKLEVRLAKIETSLTNINSNVERLLDRRDR
jgi:hypothetical protein